ncbi:hypothetical protein ATKI12_4891 [Kitasatospora sp. Ki12]
MPSRSTPQESENREGGGVDDRDRGRRAQRPGLPHVPGRGLTSTCPPSPGA